MDKTRNGKAIERYERLKPLGQGASGIVYRGVDHKTGKLVALKMFKEKKDWRTSQECIINKHLRDLGGHENIIAFLDEYREATTRHTVLVFENAPGGNVDFEHLASVSNDNPRGMLKGLDFLHGNGIQHRDLKPDNVLLRTKNFPLLPALADFGVSAFLGPDGKLPPPLEEGTIGYAAPETIAKKPTGTKLDIFPVGLTMLEILCGEHPFGFGLIEVSKLPERILKVEDEVYYLGFGDNAAEVDDFYAHISKGGRELASMLIREKEELRPSAKDALKHSWFKTAPQTRNLSAKDLDAAKTNVTIAEVVQRDARRKARKAMELKKLKLRERQEAQAERKVINTESSSVPQVSQISHRPLPPLPTSGAGSKPRASAKDPSESLSKDIKNLTITDTNTDSAKPDGSIQNKVKAGSVTPRAVEVKRGRRYTELVRRRERTQHIGMQENAVGRPNSGVERNADVHSDKVAKERQQTSPKS